MKPTNETNLSDALITVAIVEDDVEVRHSLIDIINREAGMSCAGAFGTAREALEQIPELRPQTVLMDINLPGMSGVECARKLAVAVPGLQIVMLTVYHDSKAIFDSLAAGAVGYLLKPVRTDELVRAIRDVRAGGAPMSTNIARQVVQAFKKPAPPERRDVPDLSPREREVLELLAKGYQSKEIATLLGIGYWTVESHVGHIYQKLHVRSRAEAVARYLHT
ncbi:MAG: response regulator transcription factor [Verrucomicrobia bacterium]|jgi:DNA-binding NarL/FixJ family response regulator|nr:response regulator transcription factor [Verrucomicrobiota bacterium]